LSKVITSPGATEREIGLRDILNRREDGQGIEGGSVAIQQG